MASSSGGGNGSGNGSGGGRQAPRPWWRMPKKPAEPKPVESKSKAAPSKPPRGWPANAEWRPFTVFHDLHAQGKFLVESTSDDEETERAWEAAARARPEDDGRLNICGNIIPECPYRHCCAAPPPPKGLNSNPAQDWMVWSLRDDVVALQKKLAQFEAQRQQQQAEAEEKLQEQEINQAAAIQQSQEQLWSEIEARAQQQQADNAMAHEQRRAAEEEAAGCLADLTSRLQITTDSVGQLCQELKQARVEAHSENAELQANMEKQQSAVTAQMHEAQHAQSTLSGELKQQSDRIEQLAQQLAAVRTAADEREKQLLQQFASQSATLQAVRSQVDDLRVSVAKDQGDKFAMEGALVRLKEQLDRLEAGPRSVPPVVELGVVTETHNIMPVAEPLLPPSSPTPALAEVAAPDHPPTSVPPANEEPLGSGLLAPTHEQSPNSPHSEAADAQAPPLSIGAAAQDPPGDASDHQASDVVSAPEPNQQRPMFSISTLILAVGDYSQPQPSGASSDQVCAGHEIDPGQLSEDGEDGRWTADDELAAAAHQSDEEVDEPEPSSAILIEPPAEKEEAGGEKAGSPEQQPSLFARSSPRSKRHAQGQDRAQQSLSIDDPDASAQQPLTAQASIEQSKHQADAPPQQSAAAPSRSSTATAAGKRKQRVSSSDEEWDPAEEGSSSGKKKPPKKKSSSSRDRRVKEAGGQAEEPEWPQHLPPINAQSKILMRRSLKDFQSAAAQPSHSAAQPQAEATEQPAASRQQQQEETIDLIVASPPALAHKTRLQSAMVESVELYHKASAVEQKAKEANKPKPKLDTQTAAAAAAAPSEVAVASPPTAPAVTSTQASDGSDPFSVDKFIAEHPSQAPSFVSRTSAVNKPQRSATKTPCKAVPQRAAPARPGVSVSVKTKSRPPVPTEPQTATTAPTNQQQKQPIAAQPSHATASGRAPAKRRLFDGSPDDDADAEVQFLAAQVSASDAEAAGGGGSPPLTSGRASISSPAVRKATTSKRQRVMAPPPSRAPHAAKPPPRSAGSSGAALVPPSLRGRVDSSGIGICELCPTRIANMQSKQRHGAGWACKKHFTGDKESAAAAAAATAVTPTAEPPDDPFAFDPDNM